MSEDSKPVLQINQNLIIGLAIAASILAIVLYYENKQLRNQVALVAKVKREPCNCQESVKTVMADEIIDQSPAPSVMPNNQKPPEVVVD